MSTIHTDAAARDRLQPGSMGRVAEALVWLVIAASIAGCRSVRESTPARTATEELLLSTATDTAMETVSFPWLRGKRVFVEEKYFEGYDKGYAIGLLRERLSVSGALLVKSDDKAETIVEIRSGVLSMDNAGMLVGLPAMTMPVPLAGPLQTPEIALYKSTLSDSITKVSLFAYERESGHYLQSAGPMLGRAHLHLYKILFVGWQRTDVPELSRHKERKAPPAEQTSGSRPPGP